MTEEEPTGDPWRTLNLLGDAVREAVRKVDDDREANERRIKASVRKVRWTWIVGAIGLVVAVAALWGAWWAHDAIETIQASRREARLAACHADNDTATKINALNERTQDLLRTAAQPNDTRTAAQQARTDALVADELEEYEAVKVPLRDCSPAGIREFYRR